jgi:hypothetical protein
MIPQLPDNVKSFWNRPEGTTGMIALGLIGVIGFFWLPTILTTLLTIFSLATATMGWAVAFTFLSTFFAMILYIGTHRKTRALVKAIFRSSMRAMTRIFVEIDPIGIMEGYLDTVKEKREVFRERKNELSGAVRNCKEKISANEVKANKAMEMAAEAKKQKKTSQIQVHGNIAGRLVDYNKRLHGTLGNMEMLYAALEKYSDAADSLIADLTSDISVRKDEREMMKASHSAMSSVMGILRGSGDEKEMYDMAMESVVNDYGRKLGEIEDFMSSSKDILEGIDLQQGVWTQRALDQLQTWESKNSPLLGGEKRVLVERRPIEIQTNKEDDQEYAKFFEEKR